MTAVRSTRNIELVRSLGASEVIDYTLEDITTGNSRFARIIAINGYHPLPAYKRILTTDGIPVMVGGSLKQIFTSLLLGSFMSLGNRKIRTLAAKPNVKDLEFVLELVASGKLRPVIDRHYPLEQTAKAMQYINEGHAQGKVVITIGSKCCFGKIWVMSVIHPVNNNTLICVWMLTNWRRITYHHRYFAPIAQLDRALPS